MQPDSYESEPSRPQELRAAVFVDYDNLLDCLRQRTHRTEQAHELVVEMLDELRHYLQELTGTRTAVMSVYADFAALRSDAEHVRKSLYAPASQANAAELQLCVEAMDVLHNRPDVRSFVVLAGDRTYIPLVQQFRRFGCHAFVAALDLPEAQDGTEHEDDFFLDARNLLSDESQEHLQEDASPYAAPERSSVEYLDVPYEDARRTLEIIEEHFGQYDEVYLTPLLRKLSELLGPYADPKTIISDLEDCGAVWLEKRRGTPYDYTVLLVDDEAVRIVQREHLVFDLAVEVEHHARLVRPGPDAHVLDLAGRGRAGQGERENQRCEVARVHGWRVTRAPGSLRHLLCTDPRRIAIPENPSI